MGYTWQSPSVGVGAVTQTSATNALNAAKAKAAGSVSQADATRVLDDAKAKAAAANQPPPPTDPNNNLLAPGNAEKFYDTTKNEYTTPGMTENLVKQGIGGQLNDYYQFGQNKLNDQFASMGGANSGALLRASQELRANQAHDMEGLTQSADAERLARLGGGQGAAGAADSGRLGRLGEVFNASLGLGSGEGGLAGGFYGNAAGTSNPFSMEGINAGVQSSTINPFQNFFKDAMTAAGTGAKIYGAGA